MAEAPKNTFTGEALKGALTGLGILLGFNIVSFFFGGIGIAAATLGTIAFGTAYLIKSVISPAPPPKAA